MTSVLYTQDQLNIELLKQKNDSYCQLLKTLDSRVAHLNTRINSTVFWVRALWFLVFLDFLVLFLRVPG